MRVDAINPPPEEDRPPRMSWKKRLDRMVGFGWDWVVSTAPVMGNDRVRASITGKNVSSVRGAGNVGRSTERMIWTER